MQPLPIIEKHPDSKIRLGIEWADFVDDPLITITSNLWADVATSPSGITFASISNVYQQTFARVDGGTQGKWAYVENTVTFSDGRVGVYTIAVLITDKIPV